MILLFGEKANSSLANRNGKADNHPVENSGILAMNFGSDRVFAQGTMNTLTYDDFESQHPVDVDYSMYEFSDASYDGFMSAFSDAVATIDGFDGGSYCASFGDCSCSCDSGFSSVC